MTDLNALLDRVKTATGPDREIDAAVTIAIGDGPGEGWVLIEQNNPRVFNMDAGRWINGGRIRTPKPFTASIDSALALTERMLPGRMVAMGTCGEDDMPWACVTSMIDPCPDFAASGPDIPNAIIAATLSALIAKEAGE